MTTSQNQRNIIASETGYADAMGMSGPFDEDLTAPEPRVCDNCQFDTGDGCSATERDFCQAEDLR